MVLVNMSEDSENKSAEQRGAQGIRGVETSSDAEAFEFLKLNVTLGDGDTVACDAVSGMRLVDLLRASGVPIKAECGGAGVCATCHIRFSDSWREKLPEAGDEELDKLDEIPGADDHSRLACQIEMTDDLDGLEFVIVPDSLDSTKLEAAE